MPYFLANLSFIMWEIVLKVHLIAKNSLRLLGHNVAGLRQQSPAWPAVEKTRSEGADVEGIHKILLASKANKLNWY